MREVSSTSSFVGRAEHGEARVFKLDVGGQSIIGLVGALEDERVQNLARCLDAFVAETDEGQVARIRRSVAQRLRIGTESGSRQMPP